MEYFERIIDINTGEETIRPYTDEEIAVMEKNSIEGEETLKQLEKKEKEKEEAKNKAKEKLIALGLDPEDILALLK